MPKFPVNVRRKTRVSTHLLEDMLRRGWGGAIKVNTDSITPFKQVPRKKKKNMYICVKNEKRNVKINDELRIMKNTEKLAAEQEFWCSIQSGPQE